MKKKDFKKNDKELAELFKKADKEMYQFDWEENCEYMINEFIQNKNNVFNLSKVAELFPESKIILLGTQPILNIVYN